MITFLSISLYQWLGLLFGILYIGSAAKGMKICWLCQIFSALFISIEDFTRTYLVFDGALQIFYILIGVFSLILWKDAEATSGHLRISKLNIKRNIAYITVAILLAIGAGLYFQWNNQMALTLLDSTKSLIALFATFLLIYKILDAWYYWIMVNLICIYLFMITDAPLLSFLYFLYLIASIIGVFKWTELYRKQKKSRIRI